VRDSLEGQEQLIVIIVDIYLNMMSHRDSETATAERAVSPGRPPRTSGPEANQFVEAGADQ
jgi:hypothetical protein